MKKRILSIILVLALCLTLMPMTAFATGTEEVGGTGSGEWFGYCTEDIQYEDSIGVGGGTSLTFAIKIPVASLPNQDVLSKVSFHTNESGTYHVRIYSTDPSAADPGTAAPDYEQEFTVSNPKQWEDVVLTTPYEVDKTKNLWIGIEATDPVYPATRSTEILETTDCCMMYFQGIWYPITELGPFSIQPWMIRGYFETVTPVSGGKTLPYSFDFETDPFENGWTTIDADGDGYDWKTDTDFGWAHDPGFGVDESHCVMSRSYVNNVGPRNADNWLFSPAITIPVSGAIISWYEQSQDPIWPDSYTVYVGETAVAQAYNESTAPNGMKVLYAYHEAANPWTQISVELSAENYGGKTVYIAFRHQSEDCYFLEIDDFAVKAVAPAHTHAFTYTANNGKITATCVDGCDKGYDTTPLTLTLTAPTSLVYDGNAKAFTFADGEAAAWTGAGLELPTIIYQIKQSGQSAYMPLLGTLKSVGSYMAQITVGEKTAQVEFTIDKATPYIKTEPAPNDIEYGEKLSDSTLFGGYVQVSSTDSSEVGGLFEWTNPDTVPGIDDSEVTEYDVTFTPADTNNFNTVSCKVKIRVTHTHNPVLVNGQPATKEAAGWKDYYECACGALFEDENATTPIDDLDTWKAEGGNGYIAPLAYTIGDILETVEDFPTTAENGWVNENGLKMYSDMNLAQLTMFAPGKWNLVVPHAAEVAPSGNNYEYVLTGEMGYTVTFVMENNVLVKVIVSGSPMAIHDGTYAPEHSKSEWDECPYGETCPIEPFEDTLNDFWYHDGIHFCLDENIMHGFDDGTFRPNGNLTREQIVNMLWNMEGDPQVEHEMTFLDVANDRWSANAIRWAQSVGIVSGYSNEEFAPADYVTREQLMSILHRYAEYKEKQGTFTDDLTAFADKADIHSWFTGDVRWAVGAGIVHGDAGMLDPLGNTTRAQAAVMIHNFCINCINILER